MQSIFIIIAIGLSLLFQESALAIPFHKRGTGVNIAVNSDTDFCTYLPPHPGQSVSATENDANSFCTVAKSYASCFPAGYIQSAHFLRTDKYVQVTGRINHTSYDILTEDGGGQYDNKNLPSGTCNGLKHWVNLVEPDSETFCIRCCKNKLDCNTGISTHGCLRIVPGDYS